MDITIDSNIQNIILRLGGVDYPISTLQFSQNGSTPTVVWGGSTPEIDYSKEYFTITSWEDSNTLSVKHGNVNFTLYVSYDKQSWSTLSISSGTQTINLNCGESVYFKATTSKLCGSDSTNYATTFTATKYFEASGNIMSLLFGDDFENVTTFTDTSSYKIYGLFYNSTKLLTLENLVIPCTQYTSWIFQHFCNYCSSLIKAPKELPAQISNGSNTFVWMFANCTKLQESPVIRLTSNATRDGWHQMFNNDSSLKRVICLLQGTNLSVTGAAWLGNVSGTGVFYKDPNSTWQSGTTAIPSNWTTRDWYDNDNTLIKVTATPAYRYSCFVEGTSDYYKSGDTVTLKCTPLNGYSFSGWYVNDSLISSNSTYTFTASSSVEVTPVLNEPVFVNITVNVNDSTKGSATGGGRYAVGYTATLTATPSSNPYYFVGWYSNNVLLSSNTTYSFTASDDMTIEARFADKAQYSVTVATNDATMGSTTGSGTYYVGDSVTVTCSPNTGYTFTGWYVNGTKVSSSTSYTFTITSNITITATFEEASGAYTEVSYIKTTNTSGTSSYYFDTGISTGPTVGTIELDMQFMPLTNNGDVFFGHMGDGYNTQNDDYDFRIFWYSGSVYCDVGSGRINTSTNAGFNQLKDWIWTVDYSARTYNVKVNGSSSSFMSSSFSSSNYPNQYNIYINLSPMKFKSLTIKKNDTIVFEGVAALDLNNVPCIYDKTSGTFKYNLGSGSSGGITYEA
jgi:uncharacterized repeat protein (TIGR02543 family)